MKNVGIIRNAKDYFGFENHVKAVEKAFWAKFYVFREWQTKAVADYLQLGYVQYFEGFRRSGFLTNNMIFNSQIQGSAFHLLLWCLIQLNKLTLKRGWLSGLNWEIHDELIWDLNPAEEDEVLEATKNIMEIETRKRFDWLIVPLVAEVAMTEIDQSWYYKK